MVRIHLRHSPDPFFFLLLAGIIAVRLPYLQLCAMKRCCNSRKVHVSRHPVGGRLLEERLLQPAGHCKAGEGRCCKPGGILAHWPAPWCACLSRNFNTEDICLFACLCFNRVLKPAGGYLAFGSPGRGWGVEGLLGGLIIGPFVQVLYADVSLTSNATDLIRCGAQQTAVSFRRRFGMVSWWCVLLSLSGVAADHACIAARESELSVHTYLCTVTHVNMPPTDG
jgi:hypothetical protein